MDCGFVGISLGWGNLVNGHWLLVIGDRGKRFTPTLFNLMIKNSPSAATTRK